MDIDSIPFSQWAGIKSRDDGSVFCVPGHEHTNHLGTVHAAVLFGLAETAAGRRLLDRFSALAESHIALLRSSQIKYRRPAVRDSELTASATIDESDVSVFLQSIDHRGRGVLKVAASVFQDEAEILTGAFDWFVTSKR